MNYKIAKIHRACEPGLRSIAGKQVDAVLELPADLCHKLGIGEGQPVAIRDVKVAQDENGNELLSPAMADFIPDFIGRQCGNCAYYKWGEQKCLIAPALTPVYPNQYCDGYYPAPLYIEQRGPVTLSRFYQAIVGGAPYEDDADAKDMIKFYDHIRGVSCGSCWWQDLKDGSVCKIVNQMISSYCCCSFWNVGQEAGFVGLAELRSGIVHGGDMMVMDEDAYQPGGQDIEHGEGEAPTTDNTEPDERFKVENEEV